jgi:hypothetical protein
MRARGALMIQHLAADYFFLWRFFRSRFFRLCVEIL